MTGTIRTCGRRGLRLAPWVAGFLLGAASLASAQDAPAQPGAGLERRFEDLGLTLRFPAEMHLTPGAESKDPQIQASWMGKLGESRLRVYLVLLGKNQFVLDEPTQLIEIIGKNLADTSSGGDPNFHFDELQNVEGPFGWASYATWARSVEKEADGECQVMRLAGLLEEWGYAVEARAKPALAEADAQLVHDALLKCVAYDGPQRDPKWTQAEVEQRWADSVPEDVQDPLDDVLRTAHYIILTNSSGGKTFAKKMEECYTAIRKVFPFDEVPGRRLMPVFLFRTNEQYYSFLNKTLRMSPEQAKKTGGIASADFYSTWYEAPGDPVHIHEATHQIFRNRLGLDGGGSWFQEGVAEYMSTKDSDRGQAARAVEKGKHVPIPEFVGIESLLFSPPKNDRSGDDAASNQYEQAALLIEFLREGKFGKTKFPDWIRAVGIVPRGDVPAIEAATRRIYGVDLKGLDAEFVKYCEKR